MIELCTAIRTFTEVVLVGFEVVIPGITVPLRCLWDAGKNLIYFLRPPLLGRGVEREHCGNIERIITVLGTNGRRFLLIVYLAGGNKTKQVKQPKGFDGLTEDRAHSKLITL